MDRTSRFAHAGRSDGQRVKAKLGRSEGAKPYGGFEGEQAIIERMKDLRASGMGFLAIAAALNAEGIKPRRGVKWGRVRGEPHPEGRSVGNDRIRIIDRRPFLGAGACPLRWVVPGGAQ